MQLICLVNMIGVVPLKDKKETSVVKAFQKILSEGRKPNKIWVDQGKEFYNNFFKDFLKINKIKCIEHTMKENLLLLRDLLECWKKIF